MKMQNGYKLWLVHQNPPVFWDSSKYIYEIKVIFNLTVKAFVASLVNLKTMQDFYLHYKMEIHVTRIADMGTQSNVFMAWKWQH